MYELNFSEAAGIIAVITVVSLNSANCQEFLRKSVIS